MANWGEGSDDPNTSMGLFNRHWSWLMSASPDFKPYSTDLRNRRSAGREWVAAVCVKYRVRRCDGELAHVIERLDAQMTSLRRRKERCSLR